RKSQVMQKSHVILFHPTGCFLAASYAAAGVNSPYISKRLSPTAHESPHDHLLEHGARHRERLKGYAPEGGVRWKDARKPPSTPVSGLRRSCGWRKSTVPYPKAVRCSSKCTPAR